MIDFFYNILIFPIVEFVDFLFVLFTGAIGDVYFSILMVSFFVNLLCLPIYTQAEKIQDEERKIREKMSPQVKSIKKNFKGDEQFMLLRTCYRQHNYNPVMAFRSSLSLLIQIPFFMAAYIYFSHSDIFNKVIFWGNQTLAQPDGLISFLGFSINILPILMTLINIISAEIYAYGKPLKDRIQLYSFALIFLVLLYNSPAGLVIYWTLNNLFSLLKNIGLRTKNPLAVLDILCKIIAAIVVIKIIMIKFNSIIRNSNELYIIVTCVLLYLVFSIIPVKLKEKLKNSIDCINVCDYKLFIIASVTAAVITGILVPVIVISSSMDFVEYLNKDVWMVLFNLFALSFGLYIFWPVVLYYFASQRIRTVLTVLFSFIGVFFALNLCTYGGEFGILSTDLVFQIPKYSISKMIFDFCIMAAIIVSVCVCLIKNKITYAKNILICILLTSVGFSVFGSFKINNAITVYNKNFEIQYNDKKLYKPIKLSKHGKNVLVIFIDRAMGFYAREIFENNPELQKQFNGFIFYPNIVSFQGQTFVSYLSMIAGYEYIPDNIKKRADDTLEKITNEAYLVLPKIFINNGFTSTIIRPLTFDNNGKFSIYDNSGIELFKSKNFEEYYLHTEHDDHERSVLADLKGVLNGKDTVIKSFLCFSNYTVFPSFIKKIFPYKNTKINAWDERLIGDYKHLASLPAYTDIENSDKNHFTIFNNEIIHINKYDKAYVNEHKYIEAEAFYLIAKYLNFLKANDVYDKTRIIIVSDHGHWLQKNKYLDIRYTSWNPLLMVKDFNSDKNFSFDFDFMTNADMPIMATEDIIPDPKNPYTGKFLKNEINKKSVRIMCRLFGEDGRYGIFPSSYYMVSDDIFKSENWKLTEE